MIEMGSCGRSVTANDPSGGSVIEQHLCSEVAEQVVAVQESCLEEACNVVDSNADLSTVTDGCVGEDLVGSARCLGDGSSDALGLASECENADLLSLEKATEDDCLNCLGVSYGGIEVPCASSGSEGNVQGEGNFDLRSQSLATDDSQRLCAQPDGQKDDKSDISPATGDQYVVVEGKMDDTGLLGDAFNHVLDFRDSEMSLELESVADLLVDCDQQNEQQEIMTNADPLLNVVEKCDAAIRTEADGCRQISPTPDMEVPCGALCADTEIESTSDPKDGEDQNSTCEEKDNVFVDKEIIVINSCVKVSSSPGCHGTVESSSVDCPCEPALLDAGCEMKNVVLQIEDAFCKVKDCSSEETSNSTFRKPSSPESGLPSVASIANFSSKDVSDLHCKGDNVSTTTTIAPNNAVDDPGQMENDGKEAVEVDCITESIPLLSQRNSRRSKVGRKTQTKKASRRGKNKTKVARSNGDYMKLYSEAARKKRSCFSKPARSSIWGSIGNIEQFFEQDNRTLGEAVAQELEKGRSKRQRGKAVKNNASTGSLSSVQKGPISTTRVRLKIKFGKEPDLSCSNVLTPESVNGLASASHLESGSASQKIASNLEDKMLKVVTLGNSESFNNDGDKDDLVQNEQVAPLEENTEITEKADGDVEEPCLAAPPEKVVEALIEPINNKGMDPGTSPDSEVINSVPEVQAGERHQEDLHDAVLGSSKELNSKLDATISKRGKKKDKLICSGICITEDECQGPPRNSRGKQSKNRRGKKNCRDAVNSLELSTFTQISKSVSSKELCPESLSLSGETELGGSAEALKVKNDMDIKTSGKPSVDNGFSESQVSENMLSSARPLGRKLPKSLRPSKVSRTKFKASDSAERKKTTFTRKEKQKKPINKSEVKRKGASHKITCEMEDRPHAGIFFMCQNDSIMCDIVFCIFGLIED